MTNHIFFVIYHSNFVIESSFIFNNSSFKIKNIIHNQISMHNLIPLTAIGLSETDLQVYSFLLKNGESGAPKIKDELNLHPQLVYRSLDHLAEKGLISQYSRGTWKKYKAASMTEITDMVADLKRSIDRSLEQLAQNIAEEENPDHIRVYLGQDAFVKQAYEHTKIIPEGGKLDIMSSKKEFYEVTGEDWKKINRIRSQRNLKMRLLSFPDLKQIEDEHFGRNDPNNEVRFISKDFDSPIAIATGGNRVIVSIWGQEMFVVVIDSPIFVADQKKYFELLWQKAKSWNEV